MQGKEDILGKKPPKAFILLVAAILLTLMIGLFIFIFMPSEPPNLQNLPEPLTALDSAEPVTIGMLIDRIKKFAADVEARLLNAGICPLTWRKHANRCFLFVSDKKNWNDAEANCVAMSGHLASVHNQTMYDFLKGLANEQDIWVGGYKAGNENGGWKWTDGSKFEVKNYKEKAAKDVGWSNGQPNNADGSQDCIEIALYLNGLNDLTCSEKRPFICQK